jgi:hypothetical protein
VAGCLSIASTSSAENIDAVMRSVHSPQELVRWLSENIKYELTIPDRRQSAEDMLASGAGDCEGFAALSKEVFDRLGIPSDIVLIEFDSLSIKHAVCVFKDGERYNVISNRDLIRTNATSAENAVSFCYPDWRTIIYATPKMEHIMTVNRRCQRT